MTQDHGAGGTGALPVDDETDQVVDDGGFLGDDAPLERAASWLRLTSLRLSGATWTM